MSTKNFLESIVDGETEQASTSFGELMAERISDALEVKKVEVASGLFGEEVESIDELKKTTLRSYAAKRARQPDKGKNGFNIDRALTKAAGRPTFPGIKPAKVYGTNEEAVAEGMTDQQYLTAMKAPNKNQVLAALKRYRATDDINKLSPGQRSLVTKHLSDTGGLGNVATSVARKALKPMPAPVVQK